MKKLEKLGSKLFEEFRGDEVSELANVVGGVCYPTVNEGKADKWVQKTAWNTDGRTAAIHDRHLDDTCGATESGSASGVSGPSAFGTVTVSGDSSYSVSSFSSFNIG